MLETTEVVKYCERTTTAVVVSFVNTVTVEHAVAIQITVTTATVVHKYCDSILNCDY